MEQHSPLFAQGQHELTLTYLLNVDANSPLKSAAQFPQVQQLTIELWLERHCNRVQQSISDCLTHHLSKRPLQTAPVHDIEAEILQVVVHEARTALGSGMVTIALACQDASDPLSNLFKVCHIAPPQSRSSSRQFTSLTPAGLQSSFRLGEAILAEDVQQWQRHPWQCAWAIAVPEVVGWLIALPTAFPSATASAGVQQIWQSRTIFLERVAQQCAIALQQVRLLSASCPQCEKLTVRIEELQQANQLKSEFLANTSHEIRTPLNAMLGFTQLLQHHNHCPDQPTQQKYLDIIHSSGQHLLALINDILDLSKVEANQLELQWEVIHIPDFCQNLLMLVTEKAQSQGLQIHLDVDDAVTTFLADPLRLKQMLFNLLSNALKFTYQGTVGLQVNLVGVFLHFIVWDTGLGIGPDQQSRLFQPYTQLINNAAQREEGTGLGLALTQKLAQLHGGRVEVQSKLNRGSQFTLVLPLTPAIQPSLEISRRSPHLPPTAPSEPSPDTAALLPANQPILLVENSFENAQLMLAYLNQLGYQVGWARNSEEMWRRLDDVMPALILMDIGLPGTNGFKLIRQLQAHSAYCAIPIIVQTAMAMTGDREACLATGAIDYISKPIDLAVLGRLIAQHICR